MEKEEKKEKSEYDSRYYENSVQDAALAYNSEAMARYADAATEYHIAYTGKNYHAVGLQKEDLTKSLQKINSYKLNPDNPDRTIKCYAGYSAEIMEVAERNAQAKKAGLDDRYYRADDVVGHKVNETKNDIVHMNKSGNEIMGQDGTVEGWQLKFVGIGESAEETAEYLISHRDQYPDANYRVAKDKYQGVQDALSNREAKLQRQIDRCTADGKFDIAEQKQQELDYVRKCKNELTSSLVEEGESMGVVDDAKPWVKSKISVTANQAGVECAISSAHIGFATSLTKNIVYYMSGEIDEKIALKNIALETAQTAVTGYAIGYTNTVISSAMQSSSNKFLNAFATKCPNAPGYMATLAVQSFSAVGRCITGDISCEECFCEIATSAASLAGSAVGKTIGSVFGPVGAMVGSFIGSMAVRALCGNDEGRRKTSEQSYYEAREDYERLCKVLDEFDEHFRRTYMAHTEYLNKVMGNAVAGMAYALQMNDADTFIVCANSITNVMGEKTQFSNVKEFKEMVKKKEPFCL